MLFSNVNLRSVTTACPLHSSSFQDAFAVATPDALTLGTMDSIQKLHIRKVPIGEWPRRIAHQEGTKCFGVLTLVVEGTVYGDSQEQGYLRIYDDETFEIIDSFSFDHQELPSSIASLELEGEADECFVVGTAYVHPHEEEPRVGRLFVFKVVNGALRVVGEPCEVGGAVHCLGGVSRGKIVAGINGDIIVFNWKDAGDGRRELDMDASHAGNVVALYLKTRGNLVLVGDLMRSVQLLDYGSLNQELDPVAYNSGCNWITALEMFDDDTYIAAENSYNLLLFKKQSEEQSEDMAADARARLSACGEYHLGSYVCTIRQGTIVMPSAQGSQQRVSLPAGERSGRGEEGSASVVPELLFGCQDGSIGVIARLSRDQYQLLVEVQSRLKRVIGCVGGLSYDDWRTFQTERRTAPAHNFIDGDLVEAFLELPRGKQSIVAHGLTAPAALAAALAGEDGLGAAAAASTNAGLAQPVEVSVDQLVKFIEELARMH